MFNICCIYKCQKIQMPLVSYMLPSKVLCKESVSCSHYSSNPLLLHWSPIGVMVKCVLKELFITLWLNFQSFSGPMSQNCKLHKCFQEQNCFLFCFVLFLLFPNPVKYVLLLFLLAETEGWNENDWKGFSYLSWDMTLEKSVLLNSSLLS